MPPPGLDSVAPCEPGLTYEEMLKLSKAHYQPHILQILCIVMFNHPAWQDTRGCRCVCHVTMLAVDPAKFRSHGLRECAHERMRKIIISYS
jgi:hypothetical protein